MENVFLNEDATKSFLEKESVDLFLSHPPYLGFSTEQYSGDVTKQIGFNADKKKFLKRLLKITLNMEKALKSGGNIVLIMPNSVYKTLSFEYMTLVTKHTDLTINQTMIWEYDATALIEEKHGHKHDTVGGALMDNFCYVFHMSKHHGYVAPLFSKENPSSVVHIPWDASDSEIDNQFTRLSGFVGDAMPTGIAEHLIKMFSKKNDLVVDLFAGTGTVPLVAYNLDRRFIYNDVSVNQRKIAQKRFADSAKDSDD